MQSNIRKTSRWHTEQSSYKHNTFLFLRPAVQIHIQSVTQVRLDWPKKLHVLFLAYFEVWASKWQQQVNIPPPQCLILVILLKVNTPPTDPASHGGSLVQYDCVMSRSQALTDTVHEKSFWLNNTTRAKLFSQMAVTSHICQHHWRELIFIILNTELFFYYSGLEHVLCLPLLWFYSCLDMSPYTVRTRLHPHPPGPQSAVCACANIILTSKTGNFTRFRLTAKLTSEFRLDSM